MTATDSPKPLTFPVPFPDVPWGLVFVKLPRKMVTELLGAPMLTGWVDGLGNGDFWAFEYPCGLQVAFEFMHHDDYGKILADSPEIEHVLRHIPFAVGDCVRIDPDTLQTELSRLLSSWPARRAEIDSLHSFQVWRQGDDGNAFKVGAPTSERDAKCWVAHFESLGHKQCYWYSPVTTE
jgi:hypothetical protein